MINLFPHFLIKFIYIQSTLRGCCKVEFGVQSKIDNLTLNHQETNCTYVHYLSCIRASHCLSSPSLLLEYVTCRSSAWSRSPCSTSIIDLPTSDKSSISLQVVQQLLQILGSFMKRLLRLHLSNFEMCFSKVWDFVFFNLIGSWKEEAGRGDVGSISLCVSWARELNSAKPKWQCSGDLHRRVQHHLVGLQAVHDVLVLPVLILTGSDVAERHRPEDIQNNIS